MTGVCYIFANHAKSYSFIHPPPFVFPKIYVVQAKPFKKELLQILNKNTSHGTEWCHYDLWSHSNLYRHSTPVMSWWCDVMVTCDVTVTCDATVTYDITVTSEVTINHFPLRIHNWAIFFKKFPDCQVSQPVYTCQDIAFVIWEGQVYNHFSKAFQKRPLRCLPMKHSYSISYLYYR